MESPPKRESRAMAGRFARTPCRGPVAQSATAPEPGYPGSKECLSSLSRDLGAYPRRFVTARVIPLPRIGNTCKPAVMR